LEAHQENRKISKISISKDGRNRENFAKIGKVGKCAYLDRCMAIKDKVFLWLRENVTKGSFYL
jgi:hypothetical protein